MDGYGRREREEEEGAGRDGVQSLAHGRSARSGGEGAGKEQHDERAAAECDSVQGYGRSTSALRRQARSTMHNDPEALPIPRRLCIDRLLQRCPEADAGRSCGRTGSYDAQFFTRYLVMYLRWTLDSFCDKRDPIAVRDKVVLQ